MSTSMCEKLKQVQQILLDPNRWTKGAFFRADDNKNIDYYFNLNYIRIPEYEPSKFCLLGACEYVGINEHQVEAIFYKYKEGSLASLVRWNDDPTTTHSQVVELQDKVVQGECL